MLQKHCRKYNFTVYGATFLKCNETREQQSFIVSENFSYCKDCNIEKLFKEIKKKQDLS